MLTLGLELISSETVALAELVKNAYDADATTVLVRVTRGATLADGVVEVLDDGAGMSPETVEGVWLEPATPSRRRRKRSPKGRRSLGEKGLGRFATAKVAFRMQLVSKSEDFNEVELGVDWREFDDDERYLDEVPIPWAERPQSVFGPHGEVHQTWQQVKQTLLSDTPDVRPASTHGTLIRMTGLRTAWDEDDLKEVQRSLSRLVTPVFGDEARDFTVVLEVVGGADYLSGQIGPPEELTRPHYRLNASVSAAGEVTGTLQLRDQETPQPLVLQLSGANGRAQSAGPFELTVLAWDRDNESLLEIAPTGSGAPAVRQILDSAAGVSIYRDGFRVLPYGEYGDDWLQLDRRRINDPSVRLSNNQVVGSISISRDENPGLIDQTNREGLVSGSAFEDLRLLTLEILTQLENERRRLRSPGSAAPRHRDDVTVPLRLDELREAAASREDAELIGLVSDAEEKLASRTAQVREVLARYQRLATLGQLVDKMIHEVGQPAAAVRTSAAAALGVVEAAVRRGVGDPCLEVLASVRTDLEVIRSQARASIEILNRLAPFGGRKRGRPRVIYVEEAVAQAAELLGGDVARVDAEISLPEGRTEVTVDGTELQEVLINLLSNSIYWVTRSPRGSARRISVEVERNDDESVSILVSDSGPGVPEADRDRVFEPYFSRREGGFGLGLALAGEIVNDYYGGELALISPGQLGGATFRANLRRRV